MNERLSPSERMKIAMDGVLGLQGSGGGSLRATPILPDWQREDGEGEWSQLAQLVLEAEIADDVRDGAEVERKRQVAERKASLESGEKNWNGNWKGAAESDPDDQFDYGQNLRNLAKRTGVRVAELIAVKSQISEGAWWAKKMERVVRLEQVRNRLSNWNELEYLALEALVDRIKAGKIVDPDKLLEIADKAARITNMGSGKAGGDAAGVNLQINNVMQSSPNGDLPGPGMLGTIQLSLSHRTVKQLESPKVVEEESYIDSITMLGPGDIPELVNLIEKVERVDE